MTKPDRKSHDPQYPNKLAWDYAQELPGSSRQADLIRETRYQSHVKGQEGERARIVAVLRSEAKICAAGQSDLSPAEALALTADAIESGEL